MDRLLAEHFIYADQSILPFLSILFNTFRNPGYSPADSMKSIIAPIIKYKTGDIDDIINNWTFPLGHLRFA